MNALPVRSETPRRAAILAAARACFLRFGYTKTSIVDIAKEARLSRPLIYLLFKSKEEIFAALFTAMVAERYPQVERVLAGRSSKRAKLLRVFELLLLEPWDDLRNSPGAAEFYAACESVLASEFAEYERRCVRYATAILGRADLAEVFTLAVDGLHSDLPTTQVLRQRLQLLVQRFVH